MSRPLTVYEGDLLLLKRQAEEDFQPYGCCGSVVTKVPPRGVNLRGRGHYLIAQV